MVTFLKETESRMGVARGWRKGNGKFVLTGVSFTLGKMTGVLELGVVMFAGLCECAWCY